MGSLPEFTDRTQAAGISGGFEFPPGVNPPQKMLAGGAVGDFDRDGDQDLFVLAGGSMPDRLYINNGDGTFIDQAAAWGVDRAHIGSGAAVGDVNGDGWLDIFVTSHGTPDAPGTRGHHALYINNGDGTFTDRAEEAGVRFTTDGTQFDGFGAAFGDYDLDGDLDLAVAGWFYLAGGNRLFRNDGTGHFEDVTASAIPASVNDCQGFSPWFHDMDGDRYPELLWTSDFGTSRYLVNMGDGTFSDATAASGTGLDSNGMGATVADVNNDGRPDWYVTSIDNSDSPFRSGNMLYINHGNHVFTEEASLRGVNQGGWAWGTDAADFEHDGDLELTWTNGWGGFQVFRRDPTFIAVNRGEGFLKPCNADETNVWHDEDGRGLLTFDADLDGDRDLVIFSTDVPTIFYRNDSPGTATRSWLRVALDTSNNPRLAPDGIGAHIIAVADGSKSGIDDLTQHRWISASPNYLAQSEMVAHFGLGDRETLSTLTVHWPDGTTTTLEDVDANQHLTIIAPPPCLADITTTGVADGAPDGIVDLSDFSAYLTLWSAGDGRADLTSAGTSSGVPDGVVDLSDFAFYLTLWGAGCP